MGALSEPYVDLLGLISHEYFHAWNVKRMRPRDFTRYDYTRENHTRLLWFFEGFTSYYDDLILLRCGAIDAPRYLALLVLCAPLYAQHGSSTTVNPFASPDDVAAGARLCVFQVDRVVRAWECEGKPRPACST